MLNPLGDSNITSGVITQATANINQYGRGQKSEQTTALKPIRIRFPQLQDRLSQNKPDPNKVIASLLEQARANFKYPSLINCNRICDKLCQLGQAKTVMIELENFIQKDIETKFGILFQHLFLSQNSNALEQICDNFWQKICVQAQTLHMAFQPIERQILIDLRAVDPLNTFNQNIWSMTIKTLKSILSQAKGERLVNKIISEIFAQLLDLRQSYFLDQTSSYLDRKSTDCQKYISSCVQMLVCCGQYGEFEHKFIKETQEYYYSWSVDKMDESTGLSPTDYVTACQLQIQAEFRLCADFLEPQTSQKLIKTLEQTLIEFNAKDLLKHFSEFVKDQNALSTFYEFLQQTDQVKLMIEAFRKYLLDQCTEIFEEEYKQKQTQIVTKLIQMRNHADMIASEVFENNVIFKKALKEAFEQSVNGEFQNIYAQQFAYYLHFLINQNETNTDALQMQQQSDQMMICTDQTDNLECQKGQLLQCFRYLHSIEYFEQTYLSLLADRILSFQADIQTETTAVNIFKGECGDTFKNSVNQIFTDYQDSLNCSETNQGQHFVCVDSQGWPGTFDDKAAVNLKMPMPIQAQFDSFKYLYQKSHQARSVVMDLNRGSVLIQVNLPKKSKLLCTPMQAFILLQFGSTKAQQRIAQSVIAKNTGLSGTTIEKDIQTLIKAGVLKTVAGSTRKSQNDTTLEVNDEFSAQTLKEAQQSNWIFNTNEENMLTLVLLEQKKLELTQAQRIQIKKAVENDRRGHIESVSIKILKSVPYLEERIYFQQVMAAMLFPINEETVRERIESLIQRQLIGREDSQELGTIVKYLN